MTVRLMSQSTISQDAPVPQGKILQVVRSTDGTERSTTSSSFTDASISVTITPTEATSNLMLIWSVFVRPNDASGVARGGIQITDSSNSALSGAEDSGVGMRATGGAVTFAESRDMVTIIGFVNAGSTSAQTFKGRFKRLDSATVVLENDQNTGQLFAIEVAA